MKKLVTVTLLLVLSIAGLLYGYQNLKIGKREENNIKIPLLNDEEPVAATVMTISKPFDSSDVEAIVDFYDVAKENQENSIIVIDKTYIPNRGILYKSDEVFDIVSIYDGMVIEVGEDDLTGHFVKVNHNNNLVATYKIMDTVNVSKGDYVKKGDKLGTSGSSQIEKGYLLLFELQIKDVNVNPEDYYNKTIKEI